MVCLEEQMFYQSGLRRAAWDTSPTQLLILDYWRASQSPPVGRLEVFGEAQIVLSCFILPSRLFFVFRTLD